MALEDVHKEYTDGDFTFPESEGEIPNLAATFEGSRMVRLEWDASASASASASGSASASLGNPTDGFQKGDWIVFHDKNVVRSISRVVDGEQIELTDGHGLTPGDTSAKIHRIVGPQQFRYMSWSVTLTSATVNGVTYSEGSNYGGEGHPTAKRPLIITVASGSEIQCIGVS